MTDTTSASASFGANHCTTDVIAHLDASSLAAIEAAAAAIAEKITGIRADGSIVHHEHPVDEPTEVYRARCHREVADAISGLVGATLLAVGSLGAGREPRATLLGRLGSLETSVSRLEYGVALSGVRRLAARVRLAIGRPTTVPDRDLRPHEAWRVLARVLAERDVLLEHLERFDGENSARSGAGSARIGARDKTRGPGTLE